MIPASCLRYRMIVLGTTAISGLLAVLAQFVPESLAIFFMLPAILPMVCSLPLAADLPSAVAFPGWLVLFGAISLSVNALLFLPVKFRSRFRARWAFIVAQTAMIAVYALATVPCLRLFMAWMSV